MKPWFVFALCFLAGCAVSRQREQAWPRGQVSSFGYGEIRVAPDMAAFTVEIAFTRPSLKEAADETQETADDLIRACRKVVPDSNDVKTTHVSAGKDFEWENGANVFKGYSARQSVEVTLRDLSRMEELTRGILETRVTGISGLAYNHSRADSLRSEANALAMRDARNNVRKMCAAVNLTCEELASARTQGAPNYGPMYAAPPAADMLEAKASSARGISPKPGLMSFSATVEAAYRAN